MPFHTHIRMDARNRTDELIELTLPDMWASPLINDDPTGLSDEDMRHSLSSVITNYVVCIVSM